MGEQLTEAERLIKVETRLENIEQVLLRLEATINQSHTTNVTYVVLEEKLKVRDKEIETLQDEVKEMKEDKHRNKQILPNWALVGLTVLSIVISLSGGIHFGK